MPLPEIFTNRLKTILAEDYSSVMRAYSSERKGSFRINTLKSSENEVLEEFKSKGIIVEPYSNLP